MRELRGDAEDWQAGAPGAQLREERQGLLEARLEADEGGLDAAVTRALERLVRARRQELRPAAELGPETATLRVALADAQDRLDWSPHHSGNRLGSGAVSRSPHFRDTNAGRRGRPRCGNCVVPGFTPSGRVSSHASHPPRSDASCVAPSSQRDYRVRVVRSLSVPHSVGHHPGTKGGGRADGRKPLAGTADGLAVPVDDRPRVLVLDDDPLLRRRLADFLRKQFSVEVVTAKDCAELSERLEENELDGALITSPSPMGPGSSAFIKCAARTRRPRWRSSPGTSASRT